MKQKAIQSDKKYGVGIKLQDGRVVTVSVTCGGEGWEAFLEDQLSYALRHGVKVMLDNLKEENPHFRRGHAQAP